MKTCKECGKELGRFQGFMNNHCEDCYKKDFYGRGNEAQQLREAQEKLEADVNKVLLTTETQSDLKIIRRIEIVTAECAFGMNIFKDLFAGVRDIVGGRSEAVQKTMRDARRTALYELKKEAYEVGANAVVGVDLDYVELSASGSMVMLVASGTAVVIED